MKPHLCKTCGDTNPDNFYPTQKSTCKTCTIVRQLQRRSHEPAARMSKPHVCKTCGETDAQKFYSTNRSKCKKCCSAYGIQWVRSLSDEDRVAHDERVAKWQDNNMLQFRWLSAKARAGRKNLVFNITEANLQDLWTSQQGLCYYTGIPMELKRNNETTGPSSHSVSIDRLDSGVGYVMGNIVLCCADVNVMKNNLTLPKFKELITILSERLDDF